MTPPRAPRRLSWAIAGRLARGVAVAFILVSLVALVAWPESHSVSAGGTIRMSFGSGLVTFTFPPTHARDSSLSVLTDLLTD